jgi:ribose/xylose/arabinose/galactoside ABC-type transport system permease subunit
MTPSATWGSRTTDLRSHAARVLALGELGVVAALLVAALLFYAIQPAFLSVRNIRAILTVVSFVGIIAIGQTVLLVSGEFDLSVGSVAGLCAVVSARLMTTLALPVPLAIAAGLLLGAAIGLVNGLVVVRLRIPAFIQTLGMLFIGQGLTQVVTNGYPVYPLPDALGDFGESVIVFGLGWSFCFFVVAALLGDFVLRRTVLGRNLYATGGSREVARLVGINTDLYKIGAFVLIGALAAAAGMFVMADLASGTTSIGSGWELTVIAGVVVGGVSLFGGAGTMVGGLVGMLLLQVVQSGLVVVGVSANWQQIAVGVIMVVAVGLDLLRRRTFITGAGRAETATVAAPLPLAETTK